MRYGLIVVAIALLASPAVGADVYDCGFEAAEGYAVGLLDGQGGWQADPGCAVQNVFVGAGANAAAILADGDYDAQFHWKAEQTWPPHESLGHVVTVSQDVYITHLAAADWVIEFDDVDNPLIVNFLGFHFDGGLYCNDVLVGAWAPDTWMNLTMIIDHDRQVVTFEVDGTPLATDMAFYNPGVRFDQIIYSTDDYQPAAQANFLVIDDLQVTVPGTAGDPTISVAAEDGLDWVYQNTPGTMANGGHSVGLTVTVDDLNGNSAVTTDVQVAAGSTGAVDPQAVGPLQHEIFGSARTDGVAGCGPLTLQVMGWGDVAGATTVDVPFTCRRLGDIDGNGGAEPGDISLLILDLNGVPQPGYHPNAFDIDANGGAEPGDIQILINILNSLPIP